MRIVDLSHPVTIHSPGWVGYPGMKVWYFQTHQTHGIVSQMIETPLHLSTHLDAEMHGVSGGRDIASVPLEQCVGPAAIVDVSEVGPWGVYTPEMVQRAVEVRPRDILIVHTGWHRYYLPDKDLVTYFCRHPGPDHRFAEWAVSMRFRWIGVDTGSADHPMNTSIRDEGAAGGPRGSAGAGGPTSRGRDEHRGRDDGRPGDAASRDPAGVILIDAGDRRAGHVRR